MTATTAPKLRLDFKKNRIRLYKDVLKTFGMPKRLTFLINPDERILAVKSAPADPREQIVYVSARVFAGADSCEAYSKKLMHAIRGLCDTAEASCIITGYYTDNNTIAVFPLTGKEGFDDT